MGTDPQQLFGVGLGMEAAGRARGRPAFALERLHPDGRRWVELHRFATEADARSRLDELAARGEEPARYRIHRVRTPGA